MVLKCVGTTSSSIVAVVVVVVVVVVVLAEALTQSLRTSKKLPCVSREGKDNLYRDDSAEM
jgi:predicted metal-binding membrane protein